jgi:hypothetical protein
MGLKDQMAAALRFKSSSSTDIQPKDIFRFAPDDDQFVLCDPDTVTKCIRFDAGNVTAATTRVVTLPDSDTTLGFSGGNLSTVVHTGGAYATPIVLTVADSGKIYLLDDAAGLDFTLPAIGTAQIGMTFRFRILTTLSSNNYRMTAASGDLLYGHVWITDKDAATGDTNALISQFRPTAPATSSSPSAGPPTRPGGCRAAT